MAHYLVRATPHLDRLPELRARLESREISRMQPFGRALQHSLTNARLLEDNTAIWEEEDYCNPPLAQERAAILDAYFTDIVVERVQPDAGWSQIDGLPVLLPDRPETA